MLLVMAFAYRARSSPPIGMVEPGLSLARLPWVFIGSVARQAALPMLTLFVLSAPGYALVMRNAVLFPGERDPGAVLVEQVFFLVRDGASDGADGPGPGLSPGAIAALITIVANFMADLAQAWIDPQERRGGPAPEGRSGGYPGGHLRCPSRPNPRSAPPRGLVGGLPRACGGILGAFLLSTGSVPWRRPSTPGSASPPALDQTTLPVRWARARWSSSILSARSHVGSSSTLPKCP